MKKITFIISSLIAFATPYFAMAQGVISISPNIPNFHNVSNAGPCGWIVNFYDFAMIIAGILAFGAIVYGGVRYATSAGNPSGQSTGKSWIWSALLGLLLLAGAYLILHTINPNLTTCSFPAISALPGGGGGGGATLPTSTSTCPMTPLAVVTDQDAQFMENGNPVTFKSNDANVQKNLTALQTAFNSFKTLLISKGDTVTVTSAYRPKAYQAHLYDIYTHSIQLQNNPAYANIASCLPIITDLRREQQKHGVCANTTQCNVSPPGVCKSHMLGVSIDIQLSGPINNAQSSALAATNGIPLVWQQAQNDPVHYNLINPPATGCSNP